MATFTRKVKIFLFLAFIMTGTLVITLVFSFDGGVPKEFSESRLQGAMIAQNIVEISNKSATDLENISRLEKQGNFKAALEIATAAVERSREVREEAIKLSAELEQMTKSLTDLKSFEARQAALESISSHLALVSRLINYSGYLGSLLEVLKDRLSGDFYGADQVQTLVGQINGEITAVNNFNNQANQAMQRFDELVKKN